MNGGDWMEQIKIKLSKYTTSEKFCKKTFQKNSV